MSKAQLVITAVVLSALNSRTRTCGLRKTLDKAGYDAGAATIAEHLARDPAVAKVPAVSTIWRILSRRGFIIAQPQKRPRSAWKRFEAQPPNELCRPVSPTGAWPTIARWKSSTCFDDHSRVGLASQARPVTTGPDVLALRPQSARHNPHGTFQLYRIGGAVASRNIHAAILDAYRLCNAI